MKRISMVAGLILVLAACQTGTTQPQQQQAQQWTEPASGSHAFISPITFEDAVIGRDDDDSRPPPLVSHEVFVGEVTWADDKDPWRSWNGSGRYFGNENTFSAFKAEVKEPLGDAVWSVGTEHDILQVPANLIGDDRITQDDVGERFLFVVGAYEHPEGKPFYSEDHEREYMTYGFVASQAMYQYVEAPDGIAWGVRVWGGLNNYFPQETFSRRSVAAEIRENGVPDGLYRLVNVNPWSDLLQRARNPEASVIGLGQDEIVAYNVWMRAHGYSWACPGSCVTS